MKKLYCFLLLSLVGLTSYAQEAEKLPRQPWEDIIEMNSHEYTPISKWVTDVNVGLKGRYTKADSIAILNVVKKLDSLTESISITFLSTKEANLNVVFLDTLVRDKTFNNVVNGGWGTDPNFENGYSSGHVNIYKIDKSDEKIRKTFECRLAKTLVSGNFLRHLSKGKRPSIFNSYGYPDNRDVPLSNEDMAIIKEVYRKDYNQRLKLAKKQFEQTVTDKINEDKYQRRDRSLWWVKNPISVLLLPTIILLLLFGFFVKKIHNSLSYKIKNDWVQFCVVLFIALIFADVVIVLLVSFYDFLTIPDNYQKIGIFRNDTVLTTTALLFVIVFPFLMLLRFIELKINKSSQQIFVKTILIFISTGFLPFLFFLLFVYFINGINDNYRLYRLSIGFVILMTIATIRAFISYFIFKERNLIIENEAKLSELKALKTKAELKSLQSQINPHFLYNSLNSIASLAPIDSKKTQKMAFSLSNLFKYSINRKDKKMSTISDEIAMVENYLEIERIRFGERLQFSITIDDGLEEVEIPMYLIQPLIENAIKHGLSKIEEKGVVLLKIIKTTNGIGISVTDNGPSFPKGLVSGHGLQTVYDLLRLSYGNKASLNWSNTPEKKISITIPEKR